MSTLVGLDDRPTLADVATFAGVSLATASRVLTGSARVSEEARRRVQEAVARLGYVRCRAKRLPERSGGSVAAIVTEPSARFFSDPFFARLLRGASRTLSPVGYQLAFLAVHDPNEYAAAARFVSRGGVDGVLLVSSHGSDPLMLALRTAGLPTVVCGRPLSPCGVPYVDADNVGGARAAVGHLLACGRRKLATIAGPRDMAAGIDRLQGFSATLDAAGLESVVAYGDFSLASGEHAMTRLLERRPNLDAVFAASDLMAAGALRALRRSGRQVPDDIAVIGFDDDPIAQYTQPPLSTIRQSVEEQGSTMARHVLALIDKASTPDPQTALPTSLVRRESA
ncbi:LacI family DNA-binding transcriptional regulator [Actinospica sp.]|uniref:LacI family DNA-binding transcriptional regulator n=1 Tax=Actinospica sp. TaxID=1872142 RepID=UPI002B69A30F|nr:LacI family DNA-binding transcriptional regulator [Actinospica sp.]HWG25872.1 LacI family DNA-binding transcriptional regulator [Actinospica sp.]